MSIRTHAILWAAAIIAAALLLSDSQMSNGACFGIIMGLSGAASGALSGHWAKCAARWAQ